MLSTWQHKTWKSLTSNTWHHHVPCRYNDIFIVLTHIITFSPKHIVTNIVIFLFGIFFVWYHTPHKTIVLTRIIWTPHKSDAILHITHAISTTKNMRFCLLEHDNALQWHYGFTLSLPKAIANLPITLPKTSPSQHLPSMHWSCRLCIMFVQFVICRDG